MIHHQQKSFHGHALRDLAPDLTPMLDILFIMLVFFMLTAGAVFQSLDLKLPSSVSDELSLVDEPKHMMLEIHAQAYVLDGQAIDDFDQLKAAVAAGVAANPGHELIIAGDKHISIERLLRVLTYLQSQGNQAANILMQHSDTP